MIGSDALGDDVPLGEANEPVRFAVWTEHACHGGGWDTSDDRESAHDGGNAKTPPTEAFADRRWLWGVAYARTTNVRFDSQRLRRTS